MCNVLLIVIGISAIFMFYNLNESDRRVVAIENKTVEAVELQQGPVEENPDRTVYYVVGNPDKELYGDIYRNVCRMLREMKLPVEERSELRKKDLKESSVVIFCDDTASRYADQKDLAEFVENGGHAVFAAGLAEGYDDSYLTPVLGIVEKTVRVNYQDFRFLRDFFPVQEDLMGYDGYNMSTWITVQDGAVVYAEDAEKGTPVVYTFDFGKGRSLILNNTLLADERCMGFLTSGLGVLLDEMVYPVLGVESIYLDNFPLATNADDSTCMKLYGRTTEAFVRDIVWPVLQGMSVRNELKYTSSVLTVSSSPDSFPAISEALFTTMGKSALQFDVELAFASHSLGEGSLYAHEPFLEKFASVFENYKVTALVNTTSQDTDDILAFLDRDIHMVRGSLDAEDEKMRMCAEGDYFVFPCGTEGLELREGALLEIASVYSSYGILSHKLDINNFIAMNVDDPVWDTEKLKLQDFEKQVLGRYEGLEHLSLSQTRNPLISYSNVRFSTARQDDTLKITADSFIPGQPFMVRTSGRVTGAEGAEYTSVGEHYYMVRLSEPEAVLTIAGR